MHPPKYIQYILCIIALLASCANIAAQTKDNTAESSLAVENQRKFDYYYYEAVKAKVTFKLDDAFDLFQHCLSIDSTKASVWYELGDYYSSLDRKNKAMNHFRKAVELDSSNFYYRMAYASICFEFKQYADATEQYEILIKENPNKTDLYLYLSESLRLLGDLPKAIQALDKLEQNIGLNEKISLQKYQLYSLLKQEEKAYGEIQKYIDKNPNEVKYKILLGNLYLQSEKPKEALAMYQLAEKTDPEDPFLISSMAEYYEYVGDKEAAENELRNAIVSPKMDVQTKLNILTQYVATLQQNKKDTKSVNALFDTLIVQHPQEPQLNMMYGNLFLLQKNKTDAYPQFRIFAEANPSNPLGWEQMLMTVFPDSIDRAIDVCQMAIKSLPDEPQFYFFLGVSQYVKKDYSKALSVLEEGVKLVTNDNRRLLSDFYGQMGDLHYQIQQPDSAFAAYEKALKYNPANLSVLNNYSYFLSLSKTDIDKAEKMSSATIKAEPTNPTYLDTYGWILFEQGAYAMAKIFIEKAINYSKELGEDVNSEVLEHYGDVLYKTGETEKALEYWIKSKEKETEEDRKSKTLDEKIATKTYLDIEKIDKK